MVKPNLNFTQDELKQLLTYDPETGIFKSLSFRLGRKPVGANIGYMSHDGYWRIGVCGKYFPAHRLAWLYMTGSWPNNLIDHINGIKDDNRWCNLRDATQSQNNRNKKVNSKNSTGIKGVGRSRDGKFRVYVCVGTFNTVEEAKEAYDKVAKSLYGEFYRS